MRKAVVVNFYALAKKIASRSLDSITSVGDKLITLEAWLFTQRRIWLYGSGTVVAYAIGLIARMFQHRWLFQEDGTLSCIDFTSMWVSGNFAGSSEPARMYDDSAWAAAWKSLTSLEGCPLARGHTSYPPILLFFTYPFGLTPYITAFVAWTAVTLLLYLAAIYLIVPRPITILVALSPFPVFFNLFLGQNGFLLAGLMGLSLALMERPPRLSGILLGLLTFKPQIGILFPFALFASRKWSVAISAVTTSVVLIVTPAVIFGYQGWLSFIRALVDRGPSLAPRLESVYGFLSLAGISPSIASAIQSAVAGAVTAIVCWVWAKPIAHSLKTAALCSAAPMATPYVHGHDLCVLAIAVAFLVEDGLQRGFLPGDRLIMLFSWIMIFLCFRDFSSGWIPCFALVVRRVPNRPSIELHRF
ncbi:MAG TPA: glycosyltransferase family 87 protein [Bryobacteraceae bacterium]|nr:glycosyltransferase family 87 protein [Bryobacteraceae bacterium]